jgi:ABC-2 family transporter protein
MTWVAWRQFRTQALVTLGLLAAFAVLVLVTGLHLRDVYSSLGGTHCGARNDCAQLSLHDRAPADLLGPALLVIPALLGMFWGAPLIARELESGTYRLAWTQSVGRRRWLSAKVALVGVAALAVAGLASWLVSWWFAPLDAVNMNRFDPSVFTARGVVAIGYAGFAFALGVAAGALTRRTLPAMAATLLGFLAARIAFTLWVRPHVLASGHALVAVTLGKAVGFREDPSGVSLFTGLPPLPNGWGLSAALVDRARHALSGAQLHGLLVHSCPTIAANPPGAATKGSGGLTEADFQSCLQALSHHVRVLVAYQPPSHYWPLQALETCIFLAAGLALIGATVWRIGRRRGARRPASGQSLEPSAERRPPILTTAVAVSLLALLVAGCGGGSSPGVASVASPTTTAVAGRTQNKALAYSACMRSHGVPRFPDPNSSGEILKSEVIALNPGSPQFQAAQRACQGLQPNGGRPSQAERAQHLGALLAFARCMRMHAVANFPDPTSGGEITHEMLAAAGVDVHQPAVLQAADACVSVTHGILTKAAVARFAAGK